MSNTAYTLTLFACLKECQWCGWDILQPHTLRAPATSRPPCCWSGVGSGKMWVRLKQCCLPDHESLCPPVGINPAGKVDLHAASVGEGVPAAGRSQ